MNKNCSSDKEKLLKFDAEGLRICKIYLNSEIKVRPIFETECFFNLFLEVSPI